MTIASAIEKFWMFEHLGLETENQGTWSGSHGWSGSADDGVVESLSPASGKTIGNVYAASLDDYENVMSSAEEVAREWRKVPAPRRGELVRLCADELRKHKDALGSLVALEMGKIKAEGDGEVQEMIDVADFAVGQARMLYGKTMPSERQDHRMYEQWQPLGVIGVISAFNFPVAVWAWNAFIAAVCGNVTVWKPSHQTPLCAVAVQNIVNKVIEENGFPPVFQLFLDHDHLLADKFVNDPRVAMVSFTGSTRIGRIVGGNLAKRMGKVILELGGNNAIIVDEFANLGLAIPAIAFGAVGTAGQRCTSTRRVLIHESRFDELKEKLVAAYKQVRIGDPLKEGTLMGPLIDEKSVGNYLAAVEAARAAGGEVLCGGKRIEGNGFFVEPTLFVDVDPASSIAQEEIFGPVACLIAFDDEADAIRIANDTPYGLTDYVQSTDGTKRNRMARALKAGMIEMNGESRGAGSPFGGVKLSGRAREGGVWGIEEYLESKAISAWSND